MIGAKNLDQHQPFVDPREHVSIESGLQIDHLCEEFERLWQKPVPPVLEAFLQSVQDGDRVPVLRELLAIELEYRTERQDSFGSDEYLRRFPDEQALITMLFEELRQRGVHAAAGPPQPTMNADSATASIPLEQPSFLVDHPRYRLVRFLGTGGMGSVYVAEHRLMQRIVALKIIRPELLASQATRERFHQEIKAAARLIHPNIVAAFDAELIGEHSILAMEYVDGHDLASLLGAKGPLSVPDACKFVRQAALGLQHAFEMGMVHRDIKPHNLMLSKSGQIKILDFGLAHFVSEVSGATQSGTLLGSIDYMAPEQAADSRSAQVQADIYSLGCTLYSLLTGHPPFPSGSLLDKLRSHADTPPPRVEGIPPGLWLVLARMLAKPSAERYQEPREVALALETFVGQDDLARAKAQAVAPRNKIWMGRKMRAGLAVLLLVAGLTGIPWFFPGQRGVAVPAGAQSLYKLAQFELSQREQKSTQNAIEHLKQCIRIAPRYAAAHAELANAYNLQGDYGWEMPDNTFPLARLSAEEALKLDDSLSDAHLAMAFVVHEYDCNLSLAESEYRRAIELNPDSVNAHHWYAWLLVQQDLIDDAVDEIDQAAKLGTTSIVLTNRGKVRYFAWSFKAAVQEFQAAHKIDPDFTHAQLDLGLAFAELDERDAALHEFEALKATREDKIDLTAAIAYTYAKFGESQPARELLVELERQATAQPIAYEIATIYAALGERDNAFNWLDKAFKQKSAWRTYVKVDPRLKGIRKDPRFQEFISAAGLGKAAD